MQKLPKIAIVGLIGSFILIFVGCFLAFNSNAEINSDEDQEASISTSPDKEWLSDVGDLGIVIIKPEIPEQIKDYTGFKVSFNKDNHTPNYVSWELLAEEISTEYPRVDNFWQDNEIEGCPDKNYQYTTYGYERGHICPAADQRWSRQAMYDCFVMANMCPQVHEINGGAWETLETKERQWAQRDGAIWIVAGPIYYDSDTKRIGEYNVRVPSAFFKAFLKINEGEPRAIAFIFPNADAPGDMKLYAMSIDDLEKETGYDFFSALPDDIENRVEAQFSFAEWNASK